MTIEMFCAKRLIEFTSLLIKFIDIFHRSKYCSDNYNLFWISVLDIEEEFNVIMI
jgi:hypothetical protein